MVRSPERNPVARRAHLPGGHFSGGVQAHSIGIPPPAHEEALSLARTSPVLVEAGREDGRGQEEGKPPQEAAEANNKKSPGEAGHVLQFPVGVTHHVEAVLSRTRKRPGVFPRPACGSPEAYSCQYTFSQFLTPSNPLSMTTAS